MGTELGACIKDPAKPGSAAPPVLMYQAGPPNSRARTGGNQLVRQFCPVTRYVAQMFVLWGGGGVGRLGRWPYSRSHWALERIG